MHFSANLSTMISRTSFLNLSLLLLAISKKGINRIQVFIDTSVILV